MFSLSAELSLTAVFLCRFCTCCRHAETRWQYPRRRQCFEYVTWPWPW